MEQLLLYWPLVVGALVAGGMRRGHRWLVVGGVAAAVATIILALAFASDEPGFLFSEQEFFLIAAVYWGALWLAGVGIGTAIARARRRRRSTRRPRSGESAVWPQFHQR